MNNLLSNYNKIIRNGKKTVEEDCIIRKREKLLHVCINSAGCRFGKMGSCTMCNYGKGHMVTAEKINEILQRMASEAEGMDSILIGTLGSIFDVDEVPQKCLGVICDGLNRMSVHTVIFETHYTFVDLNLCQWLRKAMPDKDIVIEMGLESADRYVQERCLNKRIQLDVLKEKIDLIHKERMSVTVNVFLGSPFLSVEEQIEDTQKTILWAIANGADSTVIFPANIRENTLLAHLYKKGKYRRITQWQVLEVLKAVPVDYLNRIFVSWYGDWIDRNGEGKMENLPPYSCEQCRGRWMRFYHEFLTICDSIQRKDLLNRFAGQMERCACRDEFEENMRKDSGRHDGTEEIYAWIQERIG